MPEHVHCVLHALDDAEAGPFSTVEILQNLKSVAAHKINRALHRSGRVWQEEAFDHIVRSGLELARKIDYVKFNPVRRGLCAAPEEYPWLWINPEPFTW